MPNVRSLFVAFAILVTTAVATSVPGAPPMLRAAAARSFNACKASTDAAFTACRLEVQSDKSLAQGKCANLPDRGASRGCRDQAATDAKDALDSCKAQHDARRAVCGRLGGAAYAPPIVPADFVATVDNPFFPLVPGTTFIYEGQTAQGLEHDEFAVTHNTKLILGVTCVEVHDVVTTGGELTEDTLDWFAQDTTGNVWYFGENSQQLAGGLTVGLEGSWTGGVDGAVPGIVMEAHPTIGDFYRQEFLLKDAEDMAEVVSLTESVTVPVQVAAFDNCLKTKETSPLEPDVTENKFYAAGVGNLLTIDLTTGEQSALVQIIHP
ncbi:MAG: hypothetical protein HY216_07720 [Candidatus Rokubacteria bacterium]|nr:hypothetical protein [Candidatus Rokubacteria bacterium]